MEHQQIKMSEQMRLALDDSVERLSHEYSGVFSHESVGRAIDDSWSRLTAQATLLPPFFPTLVERFARDQLRAAGQVEGLIAKQSPEILFVCEHNAGRSQMAAAIAHKLSDGRVGIRSAGSHPEERIDPVVIDAMKEIGLDVTQEFPKPLTDIVVRAADVVITMGCGEACPIYPGKRYEDWTVGDPAGQTIETVRAISAEIKKHVQHLLAEILLEPSTPGSVNA